MRLWMFDTALLRRCRITWSSKIKRLVGAVLTALIFGPAFASELEEVVILGARNELSQMLSGAGNAPTLTEADQVSLDRTIADWLATAPGISLNGQGGLFQSYSLRGLSRSRIRTEIDGVPILTDRAAGNAVAFMPPFQVQSMAGVLGPVSALYGSEGMGGVISIAARWFAAPKIHASFQTNDVARSLSFGTPLGVDTSLGLTLRRAADAEAANGAPLHSQYQQITMQLQHRRQWDDLTARVSALGSSGRDMGKSSRAYPEQQVFDYPRDDHNLLKFELERSQAWLWRVYHHSQDWQSRGTETDGVTAENHYLARTLGSLFYAASDLAGGKGRVGLEWIGRRGVEIRYREWDAHGSANESNIPLDGQQDNAGLFVDQQWGRGRWQLGMGFRLDHINQSANGEDRSHTAPSVSFRLNGRLSSHLSVFANAASGFRVPTLSELYYRGVTARGAIEGNAALDRERSRALEAGAVGVIDAFTVSANAYRTTIRDYIERYAVDAGRVSYQNLVEGAIEGYELKLDYRPSDEWRHSLSYQHQTGRDTQSGNPLADLNPPGWRYLGVLQNAAFVTTVDVMRRPTRSHFGPGEASLDAATVVNFSITWDVGDQWQWRLACLNCNDADFFGTADDLAPLQPGRTFSLGITWSPSKSRDS